MKCIPICLLALCTISHAMEVPDTPAPNERALQKKTGAPHTLASLTGTPRYQRTTYEHEEILTTILSSSEEYARERIDFQEDKERNALLFTALLDMRNRFSRIHPKGIITGANGITICQQCGTARDAKGRAFQNEEDREYW